MKLFRKYTILLNYLQIDRSFCLNSTKEGMDLKRNILDKTIIKKR